MTSSLLTSFFLFLFFNCLAFLGRPYIPPITIPSNIFFEEWTSSLFAASSGVYVIWSLCLTKPDLANLTDIPFFFPLSGTINSSLSKIL